MKEDSEWADSFPRRGTLLGLVSGSLLAVSLPKPDFYFLAWIALVPLLFTIAFESNVRQVALISYAAGVIFFAGTFYWITETMMTYGGLSAFLAAGVGLLFAVTYALYFVLFGLGLHLAKKRFGPRGLFFAAPIWVTVELLRAYLFSGFPWMLSGYALVPYSGILQVVAWTGIYGLSFIATAVNSFIVYGVIQRSRPWLAAAAVAIGIAWLLPIIGESESGEPLPVRIVQTNIDINQPWNKVAADRLLEELAALSTQQTTKPKLVVWPETPAPFYLSEDGEFRARMQQIAEKLGAYFILGYIDTLGENPSNSAAILGPRGELVSRYDKIHLVPFGEYVPFKRLLFFADSLTRQVGDFTPGAEYTISPLDNHRVSTAICYESIFPDLIRQFVKRGSELIVVITNDGWFGESSAPFQHLRMGVVRSVENRRYMVRTANTGISAIIDPYGRIVKSTSIGERTVLDGVIRFRSDRTFYTRYGDTFAYLNALSVVALLTVGAVSDRPRSRKRERNYARRAN